MPTARLLIFTVVGLLFSVALPTRAEALVCGKAAANTQCYLPQRGGPGGGRFTDVCPAGHYLIGLDGRAGNWVDRVAARCAPFDLPAGAEIYKSLIELPQRGGPGGAFRRSECDRPVVGAGVGVRVDGGAAKFVRYIQLLCGGGEPRGRCVSGDGDRCITSGDDRTYSFTCPSQMVAVGIYGFSGLFLDAFGLICGPLPNAVAGQPAPSNTNMMEGVDLFGNDFSNLIARNPGVCMQACNANPQCQAWTFFKQGSKCFLKTPVPASRSDACCVSGVKTMASEPPPAAPQRPIKRIGRGTAPKTKEECEAAGSTWIVQKGRCLGPAAQSALRGACERKGAGHRYDPQTMECIAPQGGAQPGEPPKPAESACRVLKPGTLYDGPSGNELGTLEAGTEAVALLGKQGNDWFHVKWPAGQGWIYSGPGYEDAIACP